jgi:hypothetical protein
MKISEKKEFLNDIEEEIKEVLKRGYNIYER